MLILSVWRNFNAQNFLITRLNCISFLITFLKCELFLAHFFVHFGFLLLHNPLINLIMSLHWLLLMLLFRMLKLANVLLITIKAVHTLTLITRIHFLRLQLVHHFIIVEFLLALLMYTIAPRISQPLTFIMEIFLGIKLRLGLHWRVIILTIFTFITFALLIEFTHHIFHLRRWVAVMKIEKAVILILKFHVVACLILFDILAII